MHGTDSKTNRKERKDPFFSTLHSNSIYQNSEALQPQKIDENWCRQSQTFARGSLARRMSEKRLSNRHWGLLATQELPHKQTLPRYTSTSTRTHLLRFLPLSLKNLVLDLCKELQDEDRRKLFSKLMVYATIIGPGNESTTFLRDTFRGI